MANIDIDALLEADLAGRDYKPNLKPELDNLPVHPEEDDRRSSRHDRDDRSRRDERHDDRRGSGRDRDRDRRRERSPRRPKTAAEIAAEKAEERVKWR